MLLTHMPFLEEAMRKNLLFQCQFSRYNLNIQDYFDLKYNFVSHRA